MKTDLKPQLIVLLVGGLLGAALALLAVVPAHRRENAILERDFQRAERDRSVGGTKLDKLGRDYSLLKADKRSLQRRITGHVVAETPEAVCGKEQAMQQAYVQPTGLDSFACSGVMGVLESRKRGKFQQWCISLPGRNAFLDLPISKYHRPGDPYVGGMPCTVTAEICPVMTIEEPGHDREYALWVSAGHDRRFIIPLGTIPNRSGQQFVLSDSVPERMDIENAADIELGRLIKKTLGAANEGETVHVLSIVFK